MTEIRLANSKDASLLSKIGRETFYETFAADNTKEDMDLYLSQTFTEEKVYSELADKKNTFFILEADGSPAGYAKLTEENEISIEVARLYVRREFQGQKLGKMLMDYCVWNAVNLGYKRIWLGVWEKNPKAVNFYRKAGFKEYGKHVFVLGKDEQTDLLMEKALLDTASGNPPHIFSGL